MPRKGKRSRAQKVRWTIVNLADPAPLSPTMSDQWAQMVPQTPPSTSQLWNMENAPTPTNSPAYKVLKIQTPPQSKYRWMTSEERGLDAPTCPRSPAEKLPPQPPPLQLALPHLCQQNEDEMNHLWDGMVTELLMYSPSKLPRCDDRNVEEIRQACQLLSYSSTDQAVSRPELIKMTQDTCVRVTTVAVCMARQLKAMQAKSKYLSRALARRQKNVPAHNHVQDISDADLIGAAEAAEAPETQMTVD
ncbi:hypothetical protein D5F01_LYC09149 [Larimichthys crocea]|uniref:Uncharacterized protein n=1 Tax=Larimichthys crocea TaxID=215358 RepID=A0A6G0IJR8_LARCR|nr:hypothetical protein D5F01_LYC09149 [Larimichthys crocea]